MISIILRLDPKISDGFQTDEITLPKWASKELTEKMRNNSYNESTKVHLEDSSEESADSSELDIVTVDSEFLENGERNSQNEGRSFRSHLLKKNKL